MITGERRRAIVGKDGTVTITELDLPEGTIVDVLIYVDDDMNFEEYLVADFLNGGHAITSIREADEHPERLIPVDIDKLSEFIESKGKL